MRFAKPTKSARPDFVDARIAQLQRQPATEKNERGKASYRMKLTIGNGAGRNKGTPAAGTKWLIQNARHNVREVRVPQKHVGR